MCVCVCVCVCVVRGEHNYESTRAVAQSRGDGGQQCDWMDLLSRVVLVVLPTGELDRRHVQHCNDCCGVVSTREAMSDHNLHHRHHRYHYRYHHLYYHHHNIHHRNRHR